MVSARRVLAATLRRSHGAFHVHPRAPCRQRARRRNSINAVGPPLALPLSGSTCCHPRPCLRSQGVKMALGVGSTGGAQAAPGPAGKPVVWDQRQRGHLAPHAFLEALEGNFLLFMLWLWNGGRNTPGACLSQTSRSHPSCLGAGRKPADRGAALPPSFPRENKERKREKHSSLRTSVINYSLIYERPTLFPAAGPPVPSCRVPARSSRRL